MERCFTTEKHRNTRLEPQNHMAHRAGSQRYIETLLNEEVVLGLRLVE